MSDAEEFEVGDIVRLKSGGPEMTVTTIGLGPGRLDVKELTNSQIRRLTDGENPRDVLKDKWPGSDGDLRCQWFSGAKLQGAWFAVDALAKVRSDHG